MSDAQAWGALLARFRDQPAMGWLKQLRAVAWRDDRVVLEPEPGAERLVAFVSAARREALGRALEQVTGRRRAVEVRQPGAAGSGQRGGDGPRGSAGGVAGRDAGPGGAPAGGSNERDAMKLPLVRRVIEVFDDARIVRVEQEQPGDDLPEAAHPHASEGADAARAPDVDESEGD